MDRARTSTRTEIVAGLTTFLTMAYIVVVNPATLSAPGTGLEFDAVLTGTVLVAAASSIAMGLWADLPYALAPGMGLNAFFTYSLILGHGLTYAQALGCVVFSGLLSLVVSVTPLRRRVAHAIPASLRHGAAAGIGLFLAFIGLKSAGVVVSNPVTLVAPGPHTVELGLFCLGLVVAAWLHHRRVPGALLIGIVVVTLGAAATGRMTVPAKIFSTPDFSLVGAFDMSGVLKLAVLGPLLALCLTDLLDSLSTFLGVAHAGKLVDDDGQPRNMGRALTVDALASLGSGLLGTSTATTYVESAAGIQQGGRRGLTAIVAGVCFLPCLFLAPLLGAVPAFATAPALVLVGLFMLSSVRDIDLSDVSHALPAFLTILLIPLTFSITQGLTWGVLSHLLLAVLTGRGRRQPVALWVVGALCALVFVL